MRGCVGGLRGMGNVMAAGVVLACGGVARGDVSALYQFNFVPSQSGLSATANNSLSASGTLIGNYDAVNPLRTSWLRPCACLTRAASLVSAPSSS